MFRHKQWNVEVALLLQQYNPVHQIIFSNFALYNIQKGLRKNSKVTHSARRKTSFTALSHDIKQIFEGFLWLVLRTLLLRLMT